jgi:hypothetical protein
VILITMTAGSAAWPKTLRFEGVRVCEDPGEQHEDVRFAGDSPLEGAGFEPSVPPGEQRFFETAPVRPSRNSPTVPYKQRGGSFTTGTVRGDFRYGAGVDGCPPPTSHGPTLRE